MQLLIESTDQMTEIIHETCRVWRGETDGGIPCYVFVRLLAVAAPENQAEFEAELRAQLQPASLQPLKDVLLGSG